MFETRVSKVRSGDMKVEPLLKAECCRIFLCLQRMLPCAASPCTVGCWVIGAIRTMSNRLVIESWWCYRLFDGEGILRPCAVALVLEGLMNVLSLVSFKSLTVVLFAGQ